MNREKRDIQNLKFRNCSIIAGICLLLLSCKNGKGEEEKDPSLGIGPVDALLLDKIDDKTQQAGYQIFLKKCLECHKMEREAGGPDISDVLSRRKPEWVMNFILNTEEMQEKDKTAKLNAAKFPGENMPQVEISIDEARMILEYLRQYSIWIHEFNAPENQ